MTEANAQKLAELKAWVDQRERLGLSEDFDRILSEAIANPVDPAKVAALIAETQTRETNA